MVIAIIIILILVDICLIVSHLCLYALVEQLKEYEWTASGILAKLDRRTKDIDTEDPFKQMSGKQMCYMHGRLRKVKIKMTVPREEVQVQPMQPKEKKL